MVRQRWSTTFFGQQTLESAHKQQKKREIHSVTLTVIFSSSSNFACTLSGASSRIPLASRTITRNSCAVFVVVARIVRSSSSSSSSSSRIVVLNVFLINFRVEKKMEILSSTKHTTKKKRTREKRFRSTTRTTTTSLAAANAETASLLSLLYIYICIYRQLSFTSLF